MRAHSTLSQEQEQQQQQEEVKQKFAGVILRAAPAAKNGRRVKMSKGKNANGKNAGGKIAKE